MYKVLVPLTKQIPIEIIIIMIIHLLLYIFMYHIYLVSGSVYHINCQYDGYLYLS